MVDWLASWIAKEVGIAVSQKRKEVRSFGRLAGSAR